jgi:protease-4
MKSKRLLLGFLIAGTFFVFFVLPAFFIVFVLTAIDTVPWEEGVGLVEVEGIIADSRETVGQLVEMRKDNRVKAVVLRVDSPGGVVAPSQEIYAEVKKLVAKKKVVVSMGSLAASGGYYISVPATVIMANPGTITGSIGVLMKLSNVEGLLGKIGMKSFTLKTGKYKDAGSPTRTLTPQDRKVLQNVIDSAHNQFVMAVAEGRRLPVDRVRKIADGRIFTGEQACSLKLVDRIGTLQDAIEEAGKLGGIKGEPNLIKADRKGNSWLDILMEGAATRLGELVYKQRGVGISYELQGVMP